MLYSISFCTRFLEIDFKLLLFLIVSDDGLFLKIWRAKKLQPESGRILRFQAQFDFDRVAGKTVNNDFFSAVQVPGQHAAVRCSAGIAVPPRDQSEAYYLQQAKNAKAAS